MTTIYKLSINAYDYWRYEDRGGFVIVEKFFTTREKADNWIKENPRYVYRGIDNRQGETTNHFQMPTFSITEITVE